MIQDVRPMCHEITNVYITGDGKKFLCEKEAQKHQDKYEFNALLGSERG